MGFFITSFLRWNSANQDEDPYTNGEPDPEQGVPSLVIQDVEEEVIDALLLSHAEGELDEDDGDDEDVSPDCVEMLARLLREDQESRVARLERERNFGPEVFSLMGMSFQACDRQIARLTGARNAPSELARIRDDLRQRAFALAPHNRLPIGRSTTRRG